METHKHDVIKIDFIEIDFIEIDFIEIDFIENTLKLILSTLRVVFLVGSFKITNNVPSPMKDVSSIQISIFQT